MQLGDKIQENFLVRRHLLLVRHEILGDIPEKLKNTRIPEHFTAIHDLSTVIHGVNTFIFFLFSPCQGEEPPIKEIGLRLIVI